MNTAPEPEGKGADKAAKQPTRLAAMEAQDVDPAIPDNPAPHLTEWLLEIGPTVPAGMGEAEIGWDHLTHWQQNVGIELAPWEGRLLRNLSRAWLSAKHEARKPDCPAPWGGTANDLSQNREAVATGFEALLSGLARSARKAAEKRANRLTMKSKRRK